MSAENARLRAALELLSSAVTSIEGASLTVSGLWEEYSKDPGVGAVTWSGYESMWRSAVGPWFGAREAAALTADDIRAFRDKRRGDLSKRGKRQIRPATRNREVGLLRTMLSWGVKRGMLGRNPLADVPDEDEDNIRETVVDEGMFDRIAAWLNPLANAFALVVLETGMRRRESTGLRWDQVHAELGVVSVSWRLAKLKKPRVTMLGQRAADALAALPRKSAWIFHNDETGKPFTPNYFLVQWRAACDRAGVKGPDGNVTIHDLRRTWLTSCINAGVPQTDALAMGGWASADVLRRYKITALADVQAAAKKFKAGRLAQRKALGIARRKGPKRAAPTSTSEKQATTAK